MSDWTQRFYELTKLVASWSKDPSTKVGASIIRRDKTIASVGFNGFPRGVHDDEHRLMNREEKYPRVIHAELNAILNAREPLIGHTLFVYPVPCCSSCASAIIQAGIVSVCLFDDSNRFGTDTTIQGANWRDTVKYSMSMFDEAGVNFNVVTVK